LWLWDRVDDGKLSADDGTFPQMARHSRNEDLRPFCHGHCSASASGAGAEVLRALAQPVGK
jgi:hypothetical protein